MLQTKPLCPCPICKFCTTCQCGHCKVCHPETPPDFPTLAHKLITSEYDIMALDIINWRGLNGSWKNPGDALKTIASWLINRAHYTTIQADITKAPKRDDFPGWDHVGDHPRMGQWYWNWFHANHQGELYFSDSPDFYGTLRDDGIQADFYGDIGRVSAQAFAIQIKKMFFGNIWISIISPKTQIIIEPLTNNASEMADMLGIE